MVEVLCSLQWIFALISFTAFICLFAMWPYVTMRFLKTEPCVTYFCMACICLARSCFLWWIKSGWNSLTPPTKRCNLFLLLLNLGWLVTALSNWVQWKWHCASSKPSLKENLVSSSHELSHIKSSYPSRESMGDHTEGDEPNWAQPFSCPRQNIRQIHGAILNYPGQISHHLPVPKDPADST